MTESRQPRYGDIIGIHRGLYQHYGVYISPDCVIEYGSADGDFGADVQVHEVSMEKFLGYSKDFFVCIFTEHEQKKISLKDTSDNDFTHFLLSLQRVLKGERYHLYTPEETVQRARSKLGESHYNPVLNNCEHFAIWCKTGISSSRQVEDLLSFMEKSVKQSFKRKLFPRKQHK